MRHIALLGVICALLLSVGCAGPAGPLPGFIYSDYHGPITATNSDGQGALEGKAMATSILGVFASGDSSIKAAAAAGGISKIKTVDHHSWTILGLYSKYTTVVTGD